MKRWLLAAGLVVTIAIAAAGVTVAGSPFGDGNDQPAVRSDDGIDPQECGLVRSPEACDDSGGVRQGTEPLCVEGTVDCNDTIGIPIDGDGVDSPDEPVSSGPITSIDDVDPNVCNAVHNITACERQAADAATNDLAHRLGVDAAAITVASAEFTQWPDACLGVPAPDLVCAQVITPGFRVTLESGGQSYQYHTNIDGSAVAFVANTSR